MTTTTKTMAVGAAALLVPLFAASAFATTFSDYNNGANTVTNVVTNAAGGSGASNGAGAGNGLITYTQSTFTSTQDWCHAMDNDGPGNAAATGDANSCDNDSTNTQTLVVGPGDPTGLVGLFGWTCGNAGGQVSVCHSGFGFFADTADGDGRLGGDYPIASSVSISAVGNTRLVFQVGFRDTQTGVVGFTGLSLVTCVSAATPYVITVGGGGLTDPPAGTTIDSISAGKVTSNVSCGGTGQASSTVTATWTYQPQTDDSTVNTSITVHDTGTGACTVTFTVSGSVAAGRWGRVDSHILFLADVSGERGRSMSSGEGAGASLAVTGGVLSPMVEGVDFVVATTSAWAIGAHYEYESSSPVGCTSVGGI